MNINVDNADGSVVIAGNKSEQAPGIYGPSSSSLYYVEDMVLNGKGSVIVDTQIGGKEQTTGLIVDASGLEGGFTGVNLTGTNIKFTGSAAADNVGVVYPTASGSSIDLAAGDDKMILNLNGIGFHNDTDFSTVTVNMGPQGDGADSMGIWMNASTSKYNALVRVEGFDQAGGDRIYSTGSTSSDTAKYLTVSKDVAAKVLDAFNIDNSASSIDDDSITLNTAGNLFGLNGSSNAYMLLQTKAQTAPESTLNLSSTGGLVLVEIAGVQVTDTLTLASITGATA